MVIILVKSLSWQIIDTPQFQRLRDLHQNGCSYFVFPSATHKRFEHSLGTAHLCNELMKDLKLKQPELNIRENDIINVTIAGLCHDLGHGPFSHSFENCMNTILHNTENNHKFDHEEKSTELLEYLIKQNKIEISSDDLSFIQCLIKGEGAQNYNENLSK